jgi:hypothetical protein
MAMATIPFEVEFVLRRSPTIVLARMLEPRNFTLVEGTTLGGARVVPVVTAPRALDERGEPRTDIFAFTLQSAEKDGSFAPGIRVSLVIPGDA